jgi:CRISPR-associated exonuclease Cas4
MLKVEAQLAAEVRQIAAMLRACGPAAVGARTWGEICLLAPRNEWLVTARKELEAAGLKVALQMRKNRNGDNPVYAWISGLLAALCNPEDTFEWVGVLREVFAISDALIAETLRAERKFHWDEPERHPEPLRAALAVLQPLVGRVDAEGEPLERFAAELADACGLADKAALIDPGGALGAELERLLAQAAELGLKGAGPRAWRREMLLALDDGRPAGKPSEDAINLLTAHSAKGLEWPVVIPIGLWREIGTRDEAGLRLVPDAAGEPQVFFDNDSLPAATKEARERERRRELVRLLYVALTRARRTLVLPWGEEFAPAGESSFAELWGAAMGQIPELEFKVGPDLEMASTQPGASISTVAPAGSADFRVLPQRILPHQLANAPDSVRSARHESSIDEPLPVRGGEDAIDYGLWWHETMELLPWTGDDATVTTYGTRALQEAEARGFRVRGEEEWKRLRASAAWPVLRAARWLRQAEIGIFAPLRSGAWIDGVVDLVLHDPSASEVWVLDWKTNRRHSGESDEALLARLAAKYAPQLSAYGECIAEFFPGCRVRRSVFSSVVGVPHDTDLEKF